LSEVIHFSLNSFKVAAMKKMRIRRVKSTPIRLVRGGLSLVVGWIPIIEPVRKKEIDDLALTR
jgi:hypothetical protein